FEFKLSRTPRPNMGDSLSRFAALFKELNPKPGQVISLADKTGPLTRMVSMASMSAFLEEVKALARS
ncbi:MAG TPA: hypothetical protein PKX16_06925, partial [Kiritimatiellia bacterium]|nr:hypothetical protein [Kiritimatiellia bacterium]